jgi:Phospholipid-translocating ATPase N-terminal
VGNATASDLLPQSLRTYFINEIEQNGKLFQLNNIVTSKYTVFNFLPKNLIDQFSKLANIYFLAMMILQVSQKIFPLLLYGVILQLW